jgi:hypothetical protein
VTADRPAPTSWPRVARVVLVDVGIPYAVYLVLTRVGFSAVLALVLAGGVSLARVAVGYLRHRVVSALSVLVITRFGLGVVLGALTGDARIVLVKDSLVTASVGVVALFSLFLLKPMTYYIRRDLSNDRAGWEAAWSRSASFRRMNRTTTSVWAAGLLAESALRITLAFWTPLDVASLLCPAVGACSVMLLIAWTQWYGRANGRAMDRGAAATPT